MKIGVIFIKKDSLNRVDLLKATGIKLIQSRSIESEILDVVALKIEFPDAWQIAAFRLIDHWEKCDPSLSSAFDLDGGQHQVRWTVLDDRGRSRLETAFLSPYRRHTSLSIETEYDIHFHCYKKDERGGMKQLPPQLSIWGEVVRSATKDEIEKYRGHWLRVNRYAST